MEPIFPYPFFQNATIYCARSKENHRFIRLPCEIWQSAGACSCPHCKGEIGFWDTLAIPDRGTAYVVHFPDLERSSTVEVQKR